jgi:hypothetical protein
MTVYPSAIVALETQKRVDELIRTQVIPISHFEAATKTLRKLRRAGPVDRGDYRLGWSVKVGRGSIGSSRKGASGAPEVQLRNDAPHAGIIERGARPFWPPEQPLIDWAERKAGDLSLAGFFEIAAGSFKTRKDGSLGYKGRASLKDDDKKQVRRFARAVRFAISRRGLPPHYIMRRHIPYTIIKLDKAVKKNLRALAEQGLL